MNLNVISNDRVNQNKLKEKQFQLMDLKYIADKEADYKVKVLQSITDFKVWRQLSGSRAETLDLDISCSNIEGIILRRHAASRVFVYRLIRNARKKSFDDYIKSECMTSYNSK